MHHFKILLFSLLQLFLVVLAFMCWIYPVLVGTDRYFPYAEFSALLDSGKYFHALFRPEWTWVCFLFTVDYICLSGGIWILWNRNRKQIEKPIQTLPLGELTIVVSSFAIIVFHLIVSQPFFYRNTNFVLGGLLLLCLLGISSYFMSKTKIIQSRILNILGWFILVGFYGLIIMFIILRSIGLMQ